MRVTLTLSPKLAAYLDQMVTEEGWGHSRGRVAKRLVWDGVHRAVERGLVDALPAAPPSPAVEPATKEGGRRMSDLSELHRERLAAIEAGEWPPAVCDGLTIPCRDCGEVPRFGYLVTDDFWSLHVPGPERTGVVCLPCLDRRCAGVGLADALIEVQWTGIGHTVTLRPELRYTYVRRELLAAPEEGRDG